MATQCSNGKPEKKEIYTKITWYDLYIIVIIIIIMIMTSRSAIKPPGECGTHKMIEIGAGRWTLKLINDGIIPELTNVDTVLNYKKQIEKALFWFFPFFFDNVIKCNKWENNSIKKLKINNWTHDSILEISIKISKTRGIFIGIIGCFEYEDARLIHKVVD